MSSSCDRRKGNAGLLHLASMTYVYKHTKPASLQCGTVSLTVTYVSLNKCTTGIQNDTLLRVRAHKIHIHRSTVR